MSKHEINIEKTDRNFKVKVTGVLDEDVDFNLYSLVGASSIELNLENVKSINSCGIREWIKWIRSAIGAQVSYLLCPKIIVDQINMVQGFLPAGAKVLSFYVPYYSEESGEEKNVLFTLGKEYSESSVVPPAGIKDSAGQEMEIDVVESKYFKFITK